ncbi:MAG: SCO family protein [Steroidobacteraceae bacterium]
MAYVTFRDTGGLQHWTFEAQRRQDIARMVAPPIALQDQNSKQWQPWPGAEPGAIHIVDFIYTRCPSTCQGLGAQFRLMQQELLRRPSPVQLLSISFDPQHDTVDRINAYAHQYGANASWWRVAAPIDEADLRSLLRRFGVVAIDDGFGGYVHNSALHLIDHEGRVRGIYDYGDWKTALAEARRLAGDPRRRSAVAAADR